MKKVSKRIAIPVAVAILFLLILVVITVGDPKLSPLEEYSDLTSGGMDVPPTENLRSDIRYSYFAQIPSTRELKDYYSRRQYPGAPPVIPHPLSQALGDLNCASCHQTGGFVPRFNAFTPITPHPQLVNCQQCHVAAGSGGNFNNVGINWVSVMPPKIKRPAIAGGPPPIPHSLDMRESCLSCHAGPAAVKQIRTPHPQWVNCTQCHVPQNGEESWVRR